MRTKFPKEPVTLNGRILTRDEVAKFNAMYTPPLRGRALIEKQIADKQIPNNNTSDGLF